MSMQAEEDEPARAPAARRCDPAATGRPAAPGTKVRASRASWWRAGVLLGVHVLFVLHLLHLNATGETISPLEPSEAMEFSKRSVINAGFLFFALTIASTLVFGRFFCGWACHVVALQDASLWLLKKLGIRPKPLGSRVLMIVPLGAAFYMFALPLLVRLWYGHDVTESELALTTSSFWDTFPQWTIAIATLVLCGFGAVYFLGAKGFCTYACPYGGIFWLADKVAPGRIRVDDNCDQCGHCTIACTSNVSVAREVHEFGMVKDAGCMKCLDCISVCPQNALSFGFGRPGIGTPARAESKRTSRPRRMAWRDEFGYALFFGLALLAFRGLVVFEDEALPFLFSLALAGVVSVGSMLFVRLFTRSTVKLQNLVLKQDGRWTGLGRAWAVLCVPFGALWAHAGIVRYHDAAAASLAEELANHDRERPNWLRPWFDPSVEPLPAEFGPRIDELEAHAQAVRDWALVEGLRNPQRLFWAAIWSGRADDARPYLDELLEKMPEHQLYLAAAGNLALNEGDTERAIGLFERSLRALPSFVQVAVRLAELYTQAGNIDAALTVIDNCRRYLPGHAGLLIARATCTFLAGHLADTEKAFRLALESEPAHPVARAGLATALFQLGRDAEARAVIDEGVALAPRSVEMRTLTYRLLLERGDARAALRLLREACALAPERDDLRVELQRLEALAPPPPGR